jgi:Na+/proline symporter
MITSNRLAGFILVTLLCTAATSAAQDLASAAPTAANKIYEQRQPPKDVLSTRRGLDWAAARGAKQTNTIKT